MKFITVFGATGRIGQELLKLLSWAEVPTLAVTRSMEKAIALPFVDWVEADMKDVRTLGKTVRDSKAVFLLSGFNPQLAEEQCNVIDAAKLAGVEHIVKLSSGAVSAQSPFYMPGFPIALVHGKVEDYLRASGVSWTLLQPNGFMQNWLGELAQTVKQEGRIYEATGTGRRAYIDIRDIAEVAFTVLMNTSEHVGKTYLLTGGVAVNFDEVAEVIGRVTGKPVMYVPLSLEEVSARMEQRGMPAVAVQSLIAYAGAQRAGKADLVSGLVEEVLQRPARTVEGFVKDYKECFI